VVRVKISVAADGTVAKVELLSHSLPVFDDAVVTAARGFAFQPARYGGQPVLVEIAFTHTFQPPRRRLNRRSMQGHLSTRRCVVGFSRWERACP